jgi:hypothetical protein
MRQSLPPCQRSPVPEPCSDAGRKHQYLVGLSLPNSILSLESQGLERNSIKFLAPVTASETWSAARIEPWLTHSTATSLLLSQLDGTATRNRETL